MLVLGGAGLLLSEAANAQPITVEYTTQPCSNNAWTTLFLRNADEAINITNVADSWTAIRVRPSSGSPLSAIGSISLSGSRSSTATLDLLIANQCAPSQPNVPIAQASNGGLSIGAVVADVPFRDHVRLTAAVSGNITGAVNVGSIWRLQAGGAIESPVTTSGTGVSISAIAANTVLSAAPITATNGSIQFVTLTGSSASLAAPIVAESGFIGTVSVAGPINISDSAGIRARDGIFGVSAFDGTDYYDIASNITSNSGGSTESILTRVVGDRFTGNIATGTLGDPESPAPDRYAISLQGRMIGSLNVSGDSVDGAADSRSFNSETGEVSISVAGVVDIGTDSQPAFSFTGDIPACSISEMRRGGVRATGDIGQLECGVWGNANLGWYPSLECASLSLAMIESDFAGRINQYTDPGNIGILVVAGNFVGSASVNVEATFDIHGDLRPLSPDGESAGLFQTAMVGENATVRVGGKFIGNPSTTAEQVRINNFGPAGLEGEIIFNALASNATETWWQGGVVVDFITEPPAPPEGFVIKPSAPSPNNAPYYDRLSEDLGGGAIGVAPFHLHDADCVPANTPATPPSFLNSEFCHITTSPPGTNREVKLRFYGPVRLGDAAHQPLFVQLGSAANNSAASMIVDITQPSDTTLSREVVLHGKPDTLLMPGRYYVRPLKNESNAIIEPVCAGLLTSSLVPVGEDFEYVFDLVSDCNLNGIEDAIDIDNDMTLDVWPHDGYIDGCYHICVTDYNQDGNDNQDDVDCLVALIAGDSSCTDPNANADFNHDGNVDQGDIDALTNAIAGGGCP